MTAPDIPKNIIAAIEKRWPEGTVEKFDVTQSYFEPIRPRLEQDLLDIPGVSLREPDTPREWQSFHAFFLTAPEAHELSVSKAAPFAVLDMTSGKLRSHITAVLKKYRIVLLDPSVLDLPVDGLSPGEAILLEEPVRVVDAFFFRGA